MLKIFDKNHNAVGRLVKYKDSKVESDVTTGDKTLSFVYLAKHHHLENEMYIRTKSDEYVIKEISETSDGFPEVIAALNLEELESKPWQEFSVTDSTVDEAARVAIAGTGWTIGICDVNKRRNAGMVQVTSLGIIQNLCVAFMCEPVFDTIRKQISFFEKRGENKGVYFLSGLNLKKLQKKSTTYDFYTRIVPIGADGLTIESVNGGKSYLENYQYSSKVKTYIWKDESYTDAQTLKEDAEKRLDDLSKPEKSYSADVRDLARQNPKYAILSYGLGDTIRLIDRNTGTMEDQRIMHMTEYESDPEKNTCEIANTFLTFEELQEKMQAAANIVNYTISNDGKIKVSDILKFEQGIADSPVIGGINSSITNMQGDIAKINLTVGQIETNYLKAEEADLKYATIQRADILEADINSLRGEYGDFKTLTTKEFAADRALIGAIQGDLADYKTVVAGELIAAKGWMAEGSIGSAQISDVNANKITAGTLNTAMVDIAGTDGRLQISDNTIRIKDANRVRVQVGKDSSGDYTLAVWDASGKLIWDALGATENTIQRKIIRDKMVADDAAIQALKIDFQSFDTALTKQGVSISGTVVQVGNKTLNVALSEQTQIITEQGETLTEHAAKIAANENAIKLKVSISDFSTYKTTVTGQINNAKAAAISTAAEDATTKANSALADAKTYTNAQITTVNSHLTTIDSSIDVLQNQIALKVEQTDIDTAVMTAKNYTDASMAQKKDSIYFSTSGTPGQTGYFFLATIKITGNYQNQPIKIGIINRNRQQSTCWIQFANLNGTDPGIASFQMIGTALFYLYKASASNWHLYVQKSESYDNLSVVEFEKAPYMNNTLVTWNSTQLSSLPSGYISATKLAGMYTVDNTSGGVSGSDSLITSGAVYQTKTEITAAYRSEINITKDSITSAVSQTYATKSELSTANGKITGLETWKTEASQKITKDGIIATVGNYYAYQSDLEAAKNRITAAESTILQQADQISLRVQKDGIISAINQTAETVKINAGKVNLTGYVTMTNLATAGQTTINGANIKTGTISADRIDVNGLFAKEITATGTITGVNLVGAKGSFSGTVRAAELYAQEIITLYNAENEIEGTLKAAGDGYLIMGFDNCEFNGIDAGSVATFNLNVGSNALVSGKITAQGDISTEAAVYASNWFRSYGTTGWYNQTYGGGWYMTDSTWVRSYLDKGVYTGGTIYAGGNFYVNTSGGLFCASTNRWIIRTYLSGTENCVHVGSASDSLHLFTTNKKVWLNNTTTYFATTSGSDRRLKKDFSEITEAYERMYMDVDVSAFRYILDDDDLHYGFMAQDVEAALQRYGLPLDSNLYGVSEAVNDEAAVIHDTNVYHVNYLEWVPLNKHMITKTIRRLDAVEAETSTKIYLLSSRTDSTESRLEEVTKELARLQVENRTIKTELEQLKQQRASAA